VDDTYFHTRKSRYRKCKFSPCNGDKDGCGCDYGVGNGLLGGLSQISRKSWIFLILSGIATVVPIDKMSVREKFTAKSLIGCILLTAGTLVMVL